MSVQPLEQLESVEVQPARAGLARYADFKQLSRFAHPVLMVYTVFAALSIAASQVAIVPTILGGLLVYAFCARVERQTLASALVGCRFGRILTIAMVSWLGASAVAALVGINVPRALSELFKSTFYMLFPFVVAASLLLHDRGIAETLRRIRIYLSLLIFSQCVAAIHSVASAVAQAEIRPGVPGPVTESGQLVLVFPALFALLFLHDSSATRSPTARFFRDSSVILLFVALLLVAWPEALAKTPQAIQLVRFCALGATAATIGAFLFLFGRDSSGSGSKFGIKFTALYTPALALLLAALIINLKRGPWLGVFVEMILLSLLVSRKFALAALALCVTTFAILVPVRDRVGSLVDHFVIEGGRRSMWSIGIDLVQRFPLGLGLANAQHMRTIEPSLPPLHRHMHNNFLNIAVETGWIGLAAYIWWMCVAVAFGIILWRFVQRTAGKLSVFDEPTWRELAIVALCLSCALLGWQVSGLVEYNFGDGEVHFIAMLYMGILLAIGSATSTATDRSRGHKEA